MRAGAGRATPLRGVRPPPARSRSPRLARSRVRSPRPRERARGLPRARPPSQARRGARGSDTPNRFPAASCAEGELSCGAASVASIRLDGARVERDELGELLVRERGDPLLAGADDRAGKSLLFLDHSVDALLERSLADELVHLDVLGLPNAGGAVGRLLLDRGIPPAIHVEDVRGAGQIESRAAGAQREHEERGRFLVFLEAPHHLGPRVPRDRAVQEEHLAAEAFLQRGHEEVAHLGELREEKGRAPFGERLLAHLEKACDLRRAAVAPTVSKEERRVIADLFEAQEEEQDLRLAAAPVRPPNPREQRTRRRAVERRLLAREADELLRLDFFGKIGDDARVGLGPAQEERAGHVAQARRRGRVVVPFDGEGEVPPEGLVRAEKARVEEIEDRLQLGEAVLDGCAGEGRAPVRAERARRARLCGGWVLHVLRLVERQVLPRDARQERTVPVRERIRRDEEVHLFEQVLERFSARPTRAVVHDDAQPRGEALCLAHPVLRHGGRTDEKRRADAFSGLARGQERGEKLDRFAETHVVGEAGAKTAREQEAQPPDAAHLIGTQRAREAVRSGEARDLAPRGVRVEETPDPIFASHGVDEHVVPFAVEPTREAQQLAECRATAGPAVEEASRLLQILLVEENPLTLDLNEGNLPGGEVLEFLGGQERVADGDALLTPQE